MLLLQRGADPNATSDCGPALLDAQVLQRRQLPTPEQLDARAPLHVVCQRSASTYDMKVVRQDDSARMGNRAKMNITASNTIHATYR